MTSLADFVAGLHTDLLVCPIRALCLYLLRARSLCPGRHHLFMSPRRPSRAMSTNAVSFFLGESVLFRLHDKGHCRRMCSMVWMLSSHSREWSVLSPIRPCCHLFYPHQSRLGSNAPSAITSVESCTALLGGVSYFRVLPLVYSIVISVLVFEVVVPPQWQNSFLTYVYLELAREDAVMS